MLPVASGSFGTSHRNKISATRAAPVAIVFASRAFGTLPQAGRSPIMPDPTIAASNIMVPNASAVARRAKVVCSIPRGAANRRLFVSSPQSPQSQPGKYNRRPGRLRGKAQGPRWSKTPHEHPLQRLYHNTPHSLLDYPQVRQRPPIHCHQDHSPTSYPEARSNSLFASRRE